MKKIILMFTFALCIMCIGCTESESATDYHVKETLFDLPPGFELVSANYDSNSGYVQAFVRKADTSYVTENKELLLYSSSTAKLKKKYVFLEKYDYSSNDNVQEKSSQTIPLFNEGDTVIYVNNGFTVKRKVEIDEPAE